ncbi:unnamed protein product [Ectocarpus sp. 8 AP-2014]
MAMLRRLHALGTKSGTDQASHLLRSLSTRSSNNNNNAAAGAADENTNTASNAHVQRRNLCFGAIGPSSKSNGSGSRYAFGSGSSPNRGLSGLAGTGTWSGSDAVNGIANTAARSLSSGSETTSRSAEEEDEESTLSSLLHELDDIRNSTGAMLDDMDDGDDHTSNGIEVDMDETVDAPPAHAQGKSMDFDSYGLNQRLQRQLRKVGVEQFFPVQAQCFEKVQQ